MKIHCAYTKLVPLSELIKLRNPRNPNTHPSAQIKLFAKILEHQGWRAPIVVSNLSGLMVAGHGALEAARLNEYELAPVDFQDFASEDDETAHMLADNELAQLAERDKAVVESLLKELGTRDFDLELTGILDALQEPARLEPVTYQKPPKMTYVLIAVPTVKFGEINPHIEAIAAIAETRVETTVSDK
ncbi:MAG TPA: hypothetical protein VFM25_03935 [Verrucomicrobiae bacterium]|nr:hypothetical protein [Verrucomicrobiae bacterium]